MLLLLLDMTDASAETRRREPPAEKLFPSWHRVEAGLIGLCLVLALAGVFLVCLFRLAATDFWWQARTGELIVRSGSIPNRDPFSWTSYGQPWVVHEWLTEVLFYVMLTRLPPWVLLAYKCGLAAVACGLVILRARLRSESWLLAMGVGIWAAFVMRNYADLRPQMISFVLIAGMLLALDLYREGKLPYLPWALPVLFAVWANLHGAVVVGLLLLGLWVAGEVLALWLRRRPSPGLGPLVVAVLVSAFSVLLNPNGFRVYLYPFAVLLHPEVMDYITEWYSPNFHTTAMAPFERLLLATLAAAAVARSHFRVRMGEALLLAATAHAALIAQRNTAMFALVAAPTVAAGLASLLRDMPLARAMRPVLAIPAVRAAGWIVVASALGGLVFAQLPRVQAEADGRSRLLSPARWVDHGIAADFFPKVAAEEMEKGFWPGKLYNDYVWGGYLIWKLYPKRPVFIDGRAEVYYPTRTFEDEMTIHNTAPGWEAALDRRGVEVVLTARDGALANALRRHPAWKWQFTGPVEVVYVRAGRGR